MSNWAFLTSLHKKIMFLIILSLIVVIFQLFHFQNSLTVQWQRREGRAANYVPETLARYFEGSGGALEKRKDMRKMDSIGMRIQEMKVVGKYRFAGNKDDGRVDLKNTNDVFRFHDNNKLEKAQKDFNESSSMEQQSKGEKKVEVKTEKFHASKNNTKLGKAQKDFNESSSMEQQSKVVKKVEVNIEESERPTKFTTNLNTQKLKKISHFGFLNLHIWDSVCGDKVRSLKEFILFPSAPRFRFMINKFETKGTNMNDLGVRMFGFLHPNESGTYKFGIASAGNSELWISTDAKPRNNKFMAFVGPEKERHTNYSGNLKKFPSQISKSVTLQKDGKYFVEVIYKHATGSYGVEVAWMKPGTSDFQIISGSYLSLAVNDSHIPNNTVTATDYTERKRKVNIQGINQMLFMDFIDFEDAFPECEYEPSYYIKEKLVRFQGARNESNTHFTEIYPPDKTNETLPMVMNDDIWWIENNYGNDFIDNETAMHIGKIFTKTLEDKYNGTFKVVKLMTMERVIDKVKGNRYHIQIEIEDLYSKRHFEFSEFLYQPRDAGYLCFPRGFRWSKYATVNVIVPLKNSGRWALHFIKNIADIIYQTRDPHIHVVIIDYESTDIDVEAILKKSSLSRYTVVKLPGNKKFNRAEALQKGADAVKDPHSILFLCDLNLKIPAKLIETIRKHCVEGKMAFAPVVKRLKCGFYPELPFGYWETLGFGLFALFKSDFDRVGGMNVREFKNWGGEDWELLDRVLESRIEVERLKIPSFYHFYHPGNSRIGV